jgi:hypothetical protein
MGEIADFVSSGTKDSNIRVDNIDSPFSRMQNMRPVVGDSFVAQRLIRATQVAAPAIRDHLLKAG